MLEEEYAFECPYCSAEISITVDFTAGEHQEFTYDCEVCCQPVAIQLEVSGDEVTGFSAEKES